MNEEHTPKTCECGCGEDPGVYKMTNNAAGHIRGAPKRFVLGHENRRRTKKTYTPLDLRYEVQERGYATPCWTWGMSLDNHGYPQMWDTRVQRLRRAHRVYYEIHVGPIPPGLHLDHLCENKTCINPAHLEPVTNAENLRRAAVSRQRRRLELAEGTDK